MIYKYVAATAAFLLFISSPCIHAQSLDWVNLGESLPAKQETTPLIEAKAGAYFNLESLPDANEFADEDELPLPMPDGTLRIFSLTENTTMHPELAAQYPNIKSFNARAIDGSGFRGKVDISHKGIHAMIFPPSGPTLFLDPLFAGDASVYMAYAKTDFVTDKEMDCHVEAAAEAGGPKTGSDYNSCEFRTYRIAVAATGEYTIFHGGTVADGLAAINTTMNRVNAIYERDFSVTMTLVANNDDLIYTNPSTDPYTNGQTFTMINQNQVNVNSVIGSSNYDIGHVFGTNSGGLAGLGVTCSNNSKARGVSGSFAPIGDPFDVDYVAHEIGHQFGATHTFNNFCNGNRTDATAVEPGSGSTIMAYAGICSPNVQSNSDDHFHGVNMSQIGAEIMSDQCPVVTALDNFAPTIDSVTTDFFVPALTPFALTAFASDLDPEDVLTYKWEQTDNEITTQPPLSTADEGPNFRSFSPTVNPTQYFPRLEDLTSFSPNVWQVLPAVERTMSFRLTVKDNAEGGGCTQYEDAELNVVENAGPFTVTQPTSSGIVWQAFTQEQVTWNVSNTDAAPINCQFVDVFLSFDGGLSYPIVLAENVPNNGSVFVEVPNVITTDARVMVMNDQGTFFDISNNDFTIEGIENGFLINAEDPSLSTCIGEELIFELSIEGFGTFDEPVSLSLDGDIAEVVAVLADTELEVGEATTLTISDTDELEAGVLDIVIIGDALTFDQTLTVEAGFNAVDAEIPTPVMPEDGAQFVPTSLILDWAAAPSPDALYTVQLSTTPDFSGELIEVESVGITEVEVTGLEAATVYHWRVSKGTPCSDTEFSESFSFLTHSCFPFVSEDVPVTISPIAGETISIIEVPYDGIVEDLNVTGIIGNHGSVSDLTMRLISPEGTEVLLFENICDGFQDFNFSFDDASPNDVIDCPPTTGDTYLPAELLSAFIGETTQGSWTLIVEDDETGGGGSLNGWSIELCIANAGTFELIPDTDTLALCQGETTTLEVSAEEVFFFDDAIDLSAEATPAGMNISFSPNTIFPGESSTVTIELTADALPGAYAPFITGISGQVTDQTEITSNINLAEPEVPGLLSPEEGASTPGFAIFEWEGQVSPNAIYDLELAFDPNFEDLVETYPSLDVTTLLVDGLPPSVTLYWRVSADNGCGSAESETRTFSTQACGVLDATNDLPINISPIPNSYSSTLDVPLSGEIEGIRIPYISGNHFSFDDLTISLESPEGTEVLLFAGICGGNVTFDFGFVDGGPEEIDCPPTDGVFYMPAESLSAFNGQDPQGTWTLNVSDDQSGGGGTLTGWGLEICYSENVFSTRDEVAGAFQVFPNPARESITIGMEGNHVIEEIAIFDVRGKAMIIRRGLLQNGTTLSVSDLSEGLYLMRISGEFGTVTERLVVSK